MACVKVKTLFSALSLTGAFSDGAGVPENCRLCVVGYVLCVVSKTVAQSWNRQSFYPRVIFEKLKVFSQREAIVFGPFFPLVPEKKNRTIYIVVDTCE